MTNFQYINYNGNTFKISSPPNDNYTLKENWQNLEFGDEWLIDLNKLKNEKIYSVQNSYTNSFLNGYLTSSGIQIHVKPEDQLNYIGTMLATSLMQETDILPFPLIDFFGETHQITVAELRQIYFEIVNFKAQIEAKRANLLELIKNADIQNIEEIAWNTN